VAGDRGAGVAGAAHGVGALRDLCPDDPWFRIGVSVAVGLVVLGFWIEYGQTVLPALHVANARSAIMRRLYAISSGAGRMQ